MPLKYSAYCSSLALLIVFPVLCHATANVVIINNNGIILATDSKVTVGTAANNFLGTHPTAKAFMAKGRIAFECIELCSFTYGDGKQMFNYDFAARVLEIESSLPNDVSFDSTVSAIEGEFRKMFPMVQNFVTTGGIQQKSDPDMFELLTRLVVVGYQTGVPRLSVIEFYVDWDRKTLRGPLVISLEPGKRSSGHNRGYFFGSYEAAKNVAGRDSYAYQSAMACCPEALEDLISSRPIPFNESISLARSLIEVEKKSNPSEVGGSVQVIGITPDGTAKDLTHSRGGTAKKK